MSGPHGVPLMESEHYCRQGTVPQNEKLAEFQATQWTLDTGRTHPCSERSVIFPWMYSGLALRELTNPVCSVDAEQA